MGLGGFHQDLFFIRRLQPIVLLSVECGTIHFFGSRPESGIIGKAHFVNELGSGGRGGLGGRSRR